MAKVGAQRAAELADCSKSTIQRAMNNGKLSYDLDNNGRRVIDVSELDRVFGLKQNGAAGGSSSAVVEQELKKAQDMLETERLKMRVKFLEEQLHSAEEQIDDLKSQRDKWEKQASQVLLTSQYSQKQAEDLREEIREREQRARERREQALRERVERMNAQNENRFESAGGFTDNVKSLWKKIKDGS